jgi:hypothetical protein
VHRLTPLYSYACTRDPAGQSTSYVLRFDLLHDGLLDELIVRVRACP